MSLLPRVRLELARRPWLYWLFAGTCAAFAWASVAGAQSAADDARRQWGTSRTVYLAASAVSAGEPLTVIRQEYPSAMVPAAAVTAVAPGALAAHPLAEGEILTAADLAGGATAPPRWSVFAVDSAGTPALLPGDEVSVFGQGTLWCDGMVVAAGPDVVEVAVPPSCAEAVSAQVALGGVVLARGQAG
jgi:hypothetical protein